MKVGVGTRAQRGGVRYAREPIGVFHRATIRPGQARQSSSPSGHQPNRGPPVGAELDTVGAFRVDDPENRVGIETHVINAEGTLLQVPFTYREEPADGTEDAFVTQMEHSELGTRWVHEGLDDQRFVVVLAAVAMTGQGEALGMARHDGRWHLAPANVRIHGGGWGLERVPVDRFRVESDNTTTVVFTNDRFELTFFRRPDSGARPPIGLTATWEGQPDPVVLAEVRGR